MHIQFNPDFYEFYELVKDKEGCTDFQQVGPYTLIFKWKGVEYATSSSEGRFWLYDNTDLANGRAFASQSEAADFILK